jgi:hypothetical protein
MISLTTCCAGLKRKGSSLTHTHHKSLRTTVDSFVYRPSNEEYLGDVNECRLEPLRTAMAVDALQFSRLTVRTTVNSVILADFRYIHTYI